MLAGASVYASFSRRTDKYMDKSTEGHIFEMLEMVARPYNEHLERAIGNLDEVNDYLTARFRSRSCRMEELVPYIQYIKRSQNADKFLFMDTGCTYLSSTGDKGLLDITSEVVSLFGENKPMIRYLNWIGGESRYMVAKAFDDFYVDGRKYNALVTLYTPETMNRIFDIPGFDGESEIFVLDNIGTVIFTNNGTTVGGSNLLSQYRASKTLTTDQVNSIKEDFHNGTDNSLIIEDDGQECYFCYKPSEEADFNIVMQVGVDTARSSLSELRTMVSNAATTIAVILCIAIAVLLLLYFKNEQSRKAAENEQKANKAKTVFLNNMSHDIRTPMNAIIGYTNLAMQNADDPSQTRDYLGKIGQSSRHLLSLINDVLDMSRIESGKIVLDNQAESMGEIIDTLCNMVDANLSRKRLSFEVKTGIVHDTVVCDRLRLNQILLNILSNSIKYTDSGGRISFEVSEEESRLPGHSLYHFIIEDNGMGMSEDFLKTIYDPFTRAKTSTVSGIQGTGLGMSITKNLVDMMGGSIDISSGLGKGTRVDVRLNLELTAATAAGQVRTEVEDFDFNGRKVLLVEDNELNTEIATMILETAGMEVSTANDGTVAVDMMRNAKTGDYDLILMDIQMPVMDGYEATRKIRALGTEVSRIPIIAMTANAFKEDREAALEAGMDEHVAKPVDIDKLRKAIASVLNR